MNPASAISSLLACLLACFRPCWHLIKTFTPDCESLLPVDILLAKGIRIWVATGILVPAICPGNDLEISILRYTIMPFVLCPPDPLVLLRLVESICQWCCWCSTAQYLNRLLFVFSLSSIYINSFHPTHACHSLPIPLLLPLLPPRSSTCNTLRDR